MLAFPSQARYLYDPPVFNVSQRQNHRAKPMKGAGAFFLEIINNKRQNDSPGKEKEHKRDKKQQQQQKKKQAIEYTDQNIKFARY